MGTVKFDFNVSYEGCNEETRRAIEDFMRVVHEGVKNAVHETGERVVTIKTMTDDGSEEVTEWSNPAPAAIALATGLKRELDVLKQLIVDADEVARQRGDKYGLCDSIDNGGAAYPSAAAATWIERIKSEGRKPMLFLKDLEG